MSIRILPLPGRVSCFTLQEKIDAICDVILGHENPAEVVTKLYQSHGMTAPEHPGSVLSTWRMAINVKIKAGGPAAERIMEIIRATDDKILADMPDEPEIPGRRRGRRPAAPPAEAVPVAPVQ